MPLRTKKETLIDNLLLLYLVEKTNKMGKMDDLFKLQKMVFLSEYSMMKRRIKGFNYQFHRWKRGPFSKDVSVDFCLLDNDKILENPKFIKISEKGKEILQLFGEILKNNRDILAHLDATINEYAKMSCDRIKEIVYNKTITLPRTKERKKIADIKLGKPILFKISNKQASKIFKIDEDSLENIDMLLDAHIIESVERAKSDIKEGRLHSVKQEVYLS